MKRATSIILTIETPELLPDVNTGRTVKSVFELDMANKNIPLRLFGENVIENIQDIYTGKAVELSYEIHNPYAGFELAVYLDDEFPAGNEYYTVWSIEHIVSISNDEWYTSEEKLLHALFGNAHEEALTYNDVDRSDEERDERT